MNYYCYKRALFSNLSLIALISLHFFDEFYFICIHPQYIVVSWVLLRGERERETIPNLYDDSKGNINNHTTAY